MMVERCRSAVHVRVYRGYAGDAIMRVQLHAQPLGKHHRQRKARGEEIAASMGTKK